MTLLPLPSEVDFGKLQVETSLIFMASARICHRRPKMGSSTFLVGSACQLLLGREVQAAQPEEDYRPEIGDAPEAPCSAADRLDDGVQPFQERVCGAPLPPVQDALPLLPERPRHGLHLPDIGVHLASTPPPRPRAPMGVPSRSPTAPRAARWPPSRSPCAGPDDSGPHTGVSRNQTLPG